MNTHPLAQPLESIDLELHAPELEAKANPLTRLEPTLEERRGWGLGEEPFRKELLAQMSGRKEWNALGLEAGAI